MPDDVLSRLQRRRDRKRVDTVRSRQEISSGPQAGRVLSTFCDLEPNSAMRCFSMRGNGGMKRTYDVPGLHCVMSEGARAM